MKLADANPHHTNCFLFHPWICFKMLEESICFALFSKHNVSKQQINFSMIKQLCICLVNRQTWHSQWWLIQFSDYHKIVKSLGKAESNVEELLSRCSSLGFTEHSCRYAIPYNFVDEIIFVFVVLNEAFHLTLYLTSIFFSKKWNWSPWKTLQDIHTHSSFPHLLWSLTRSWWSLFKQEVLLRGFTVHMQKLLSLQCLCRKTGHLN